MCVCVCVCTCKESSQHASMVMPLVAKLVVGPFAIAFKAEWVWGAMGRSTLVAIDRGYFANLRKNVFLTFTKM